MDTFQVERMRALRRDSYRCQARDHRGVPCLHPTARVVYRDANGPLTADNMTTVCTTH